MILAAVVVAGCTNDVSVDVPKVDPKRIDLTLGHSGSLLATPIWLGSGVTGTIDWGDGCEEPYSDAISHSYTDDGYHNAIFRMDNTTAFKIERLGDIDAIEIAYSK